MGFISFGLLTQTARTTIGPTRCCLSTTGTKTEMCFACRRDPRAPQGCLWRQALHRALVPCSGRLYQRRCQQELLVDPGEGVRESEPDQDQERAQNGVLEHGRGRCQQSSSSPNLDRYFRRCPNTHAFILTNNSPSFACKPSFAPTHLHTHTYAPASTYLLT